MKPFEELPSRRETLHVGPDRTPLLDRLLRGGRQRGRALLAALVLGAMAGAGAVRLWDGPRAEPVEAPPPPVAPAAAEVRLVLTGVLDASGTDIRHRGDRASPLRLDAVLLHDRGPESATVRRIHRVGRALAIRAPELPVALSVNHPLERVRLQVSPRDCGLATQWTPSAQPFTLTWEDSGGGVHRALGGDHDAQVAIALTRYVDAACERQPG